MNELPKKTPEEKIIDFLKEKPDERFSMLEISRRTELSYPTIQKYLIILEYKGLIEVKDFGNIKIVNLKRLTNERGNT
jgi:response regulator of citrate/malate metabolism